MSLLTTAEDFAGLQFSDLRATKTILDVTLPLNSSRSLLFIDSGVEDVQTLVNGASGAEVHLLRSGEDAVAQIAQTLLGRSGIESLQIVSHGRSGGLKLGESWLDSQSLPSYVGQLKSWGQALTVEADILLYGCNVGRDEAGKAFVNLLAQATGADVAASDDLTGNGFLGGDWDLEVRSGLIEAVGLMASDYGAVLLSFSSTAKVTVGSNPTSITSVDVNRDGKLDLLVANEGSNYVSVKLGDGLGGFSVADDVVGDGDPRSVTSGDINGDGKLDILVANLSGKVSVRLGDGLGGFSGNTSVSVGAGSFSVTIEDVNRDGKLDFLAANRVSNTVSVRLGDGLGGFSGSDVAVVGGPSSVVLGDVNGDGKLDFLSANNFSDNVSVRLGDGLGGFSGTTNVTVGDAPGFIALGDVNGDGKLDFLTANNDSGNVSVRLGDGLGGFSGTTNITVGSSPQAVTLGDINGDGKLDLLTANNGSNDISISLGDGLGGFSGTTNIAVGTKPFAVALGDVNRDGKLDILAANNGSSDVSILLNTTPTVTVSAGTAPAEEVSNGSFTIALDRPAPAGGLVVNYSLSGTATVGADYSLSQAESTNITAIAPGSFTIAAGQTTATIAVTIVKDGIVDPNETIGLNILSGDYFRDSVTPRFIATSSSEVAVGFAPVSSVLGDINGDGNIDLLTANAGANNVSVQLGDGLGGFSGTTKVAVGQQPTSIALGDVNRDGKLDFLTVNNEDYDRSGSVSVRLGDGMGGFSGTTNIAINSILRSLTLGDVNGDGKLDFLTVDITSNTVLVRLGDGLGGFSGTTNVAVGPYPFSVTLGDVNRDGKLDLLTANNNLNSGSVSVRLGDGLGGFSGTTNVTVGPNPIFVTLGDVNRDGKLDLLTANSNREGSVSIRLGDGLGGFSGTTDVVVGLNPSSVSLGDMNGDGKLDLFTANSGFYTSGNGPDSVSVSFGDGLGGFSGTTPVITGLNPKSALLADVNHDGKLDFLATNLGSNTVSVRLSQPGADLVIREPIVQRPQSDLLLRNPSSGEVRILGLNKNQIAVSEAAQLADGTVVRPDADWKLVSGKLDFNGDSIRDFVWFNTATGESAIWYMQKGSTGLSNIIGSNSSFVYLPGAQSSFRVGTGWQLFAAVENRFNGGQRPQFLWEDRVTGASAIWDLNIASNGRAEINLSTSALITYGNAPVQTGGAESGWKLVGVGNFDLGSDPLGKGLVWFNEKTSETGLWVLSSGNTSVVLHFILSDRSGIPLRPLGWKPVAVGNIDGQGKDEIVWQNGTAVAVWNLGDNYRLTEKSVILNQSLAAGEQVQGLADLNLDGILDLVVRQKGSDVDGTHIYYMNGVYELSAPSQFLVQPPAMTAYVTGDRRFDIIDAVDFGGPLVSVPLR